MNDGLAQRFEAIYADADDPWSYETSAYEADKYAATLAALPPAPIPRALEIGCSIGVFTALLARRCDAVVAVDFSEVAIERARRRIRCDRGVRFERLDARVAIPPGRFDAVICSDVLYYWRRAEVELAVAAIEAGLARGGSLVAANWSGDDPEAPLDAVAVEAILNGRKALVRTHREVAEGYLLGRWERR